MWCGKALDIFTWLMTPEGTPLWCSLGGNSNWAHVEMPFLLSPSLLALRAAPGKRWNASCLIHFIWLVTTFLVFGCFHMRKKLLFRPQLCRSRSDAGVLAWHSWPLAPHKKQGWCTQIQFQNLGEWRKENQERKATPATELIPVRLAYMKRGLKQTRHPEST